MRQTFIFLISIFTFTACAQPNTFDEMVEETIHQTIPTISTSKLYTQLTNNEELLLLDAREKKEYDVSHIEGAKYVGYDHFKVNRLKDVNKSTPIVVYCSVGYRSEKVGEQLKEAGFTNVLNLYGGIFDWKNKDYPIVDSNSQKTEKIHAYNKSWGKWLTAGEQVYE